MSMVHTFVCNLRLKDGTEENYKRKIIKEHKISQQLDRALMAKMKIR